MNECDYEEDPTEGWLVEVRLRERRNGIDLDRLASKVYYKTFEEAAKSFDAKQSPEALQYIGSAANLVDMFKIKE